MCVSGGGGEHMGQVGICGHTSKKRRGLSGEEREEGEGEGEKVGGGEGTLPPHPSPVILILQSWSPDTTVSPSGMRSSIIIPDTGAGTGRAVWD